MTFASVHERLQQESPSGAGFAVAVTHIERLVQEEIKRVVSTAMAGKDVPIIGFPTLAFTLEIVPADFRFDATNAEISVDKIVVNVHVRSDPANKLAVLEYKLHKTPVAVELAADNRLQFKPQRDDQVEILTQQVVATDAALILAGFVDSAGAADKKRFMEEFYYGFVFITSRGLLRSIVASMPFPQVHKWLRAVRMVPPFVTFTGEGYVAVYCKEASLDFGHCGTASTGPRPQQSFENISAAAGLPKSPIDEGFPPFVLYTSSSVLLDWYSGALAPAIMYSADGGGFIGWALMPPLA